MLTRMYVVRCDACGRWSAQSGFGTSKLARAHAKRNGWQRGPAVHAGVKDWCPRCVGRERRAE